MVSTQEKRGNDHNGNESVYFYTDIDWYNLPILFYKRKQYDDKFLGT